MVETTQKTVGEIVAENPAAARLFEKHQIDYCCNGKRFLDEVCAEKGIRLDSLARELEQAASAQPQPERDWTTASLRELIEHILATHHDYLKRELPRLESLIGKVLEAHGPNHGDSLRPLAQIFAGLREELEGHMHKEEMILFPFIVKIEAAIQVGRAAPPLPFGSIGNPIRVMEMEHESAGQALSEMRRLTNGYTAPADACNTYRATLQGLAELEADLHQHIHLENNILFPRALGL